MSDELASQVSSQIDYSIQGSAQGCSPKVQRKDSFVPYTYNMSIIYIAHTYIPEKSPRSGPLDLRQNTHHDPLCMYVLMYACKYI